MPVHYFNQLGDNFVVYLLENIENPPSREHEREIVDIFIGLVLSYNLQFKDKSSNVAVKCLRSMSSAKAFTEQVGTPGLKQSITIKSDAIVIDRLEFGFSSGDGSGILFWLVSGKAALICPSYARRS